MHVKNSFLSNDTKILILINTNLILLVRAHENGLKPFFFFFFCGQVKLGQMLKSESH